MARCGCGGGGGEGGVCSCALVAGQGTQVTGNGSPATPYTVSVCVSPEPNGVEFGPDDCLSVPTSADAGNALTFGSDDRLFVPAAAAGCPTSDTPDCLLFTVDGAGVCHAALVIDPDICNNGLTCGPDGLIAPPQTQHLRASSFGSPNPFPDFAGKGPFITLTGPVALAPRRSEQQVCLANPSVCRSMQATVEVGGFYAGLMWDENDGIAGNVERHAFGMVEVVNNGVPEPEIRAFEFSESDAGGDENGPVRTQSIASAGGHYARTVVIPPGGQVCVNAYLYVQLSEAGDQASVASGNINIEGMTL